MLSSNIRNAFACQAELSDSDDESVQSNDTSDGSQEDHFHPAVPETELEEAFDTVEGRPIPRLHDDRGVDSITTTGQYPPSCSRRAACQLDQPGHHPCPQVLVKLGGPFTYVLRLSLLLK